MSNRSSSRRGERRARIDPRVAAAPREAAPHLVLVASPDPVRRGSDPVAGSPPLPSAVPHPPPSREAFCASLKATRERRGVTVRDIAEATKIGPGLLTALERGDLSRWPGGIYRRAFFAAYAQAIGLPADRATADFLRLFADETPAPRPAAEDPEAAADVRLSLAGPPRPAAGHSRAWINVLIVVAAALLAGTALRHWLWALVVIAAWYGRPLLTRAAQALVVARRRAMGVRSGA